MVSIESDPRAWRQEKAMVACRDLEALRIRIHRVEKSSQSHPEGMISQALDNFRFINEEVSPVVQNFYELSNRSLEFKKRFSLSPAGAKSIRYNSRELPNKLVYTSDLGEKLVELTEDMLKMLWNANINRDAVESLARPSKDQIIDKFKLHISSNK